MPASQAASSLRPEFNAKTRAIVGRLFLIRSKQAARMLMKAESLIRAARP